MARPASRRADRWFLGAGIALAALGLLYFVVHPAFAPPGRRAPLLSLVQPIYDVPSGLIALRVSLGESAAAGYAMIMALACIAHTIAYRAASRRNSTHATGVVLGFALASALLVTGIPIHSVDVFAYLSIAEITDRGLDPYAETPAQHRDLATTSYGPWFGTPHASLYGPLATRLFSWLFFPGRELWINLVVWKAFVALLAGFTAFLLWDCWRALGRSPRERVALLVMFAWSPLLLSEVALHGHVDALIALFLALGMGQFVRGRETLGLVLLASAISVKMNFLILWPAILARAVMGAPTLRMGFRRAAIVVLGATAFSAVWLLPNLGNPVAPLLHLGALSQNSLAHLLKRLLPGASGRDSYVPWVMSALMFVVFTLGLSAVRQRAAFLQRLCRDYLLYLTLFGQIFHQWYVLPALVLASVSDNPRHRAATLWLASAAIVVLPARRMIARMPGLEPLQFLIVLLPAAILVLLPERLSPRDPKQIRGTTP